MFGVPATSKFGNATAWYTCVSTILKVLNLAFNTVNNVHIYIFTGAHDKLVDKCLLTRMLMQLKTAVLVKLFVEVILHILPVNNMKTLSALTVAH